MNSCERISDDLTGKAMNNHRSRASDVRRSGSFVDDKSQTNCEATQSDKAAENKSDRESKDSNERRQQRHNYDEEAAKHLHAKNEKDAPLKHYKGYLKLSLCGFILMALSYTIHYADPLQVIKNMAMKMEEGSFIFNLWREPPVNVYIKVFIFNITNAEAFLAKNDTKLRVKEVGPYVYREFLENGNITFNANSTLTFTPKRTLRFEPDLSVGDPTVDTLIVTNIPLLGMTSMLHQSSFATNLALSALVSYLDTQPFKNISVHEFLWGYEEPLVKVASTILPSWIDFPKFGLLDRLLDEGVNTITMRIADEKSNRTDKERAFQIDQYNGVPGLPQWGYEPGKNRTKCSNVQGAIEGILYPRNLSPNQSFSIYRKAFCRTLPLVYDKQSFSNRGVPVFRYVVADNALDSPDKNPDNECYCKEDDACLPSGLSDISPCYYGIPVAISLPHFYKADPELLEEWEELSPDEDKHKSLILVQPDLGLPVYLKTMVQLNLVVHKTMLSPRVKPFNNMIIPVFWLNVEVADLPDSVNNLVELIIFFIPPIQKAVIWVLFFVGFASLLLASIGYVWLGGLFKNRWPLISKNMRKEQDQDLFRATWGGSQYSKVQIVSIPAPHVLERGR